MFGQIGPTSLDLRFSLVGIPVRVHPAFWVVSAIMGSRLNDPRLVVVWVGCVFVSILVHEMGHALTARFFGWPPDVLLYHFGGLAMYQPTWGFTTSRSILISFAGPAAGFLLFGLTLLVEYALIQTRTFPGELGAHALYFMRYINLWWGLINLLPVLPLDGGQICRDTCTALRLKRGHDVALKISILVGAGVAIYALANKDMYIGLLFGFLAFQNYQSLRSYGGHSNW